MDYYHYDEQDKNPSHYEYNVASAPSDLIDNERMKQRVSKSMDQLEGWCTKFKAFTLIDLIIKTKAETIVEIGVWGGKSLVPMAYALKELDRGMAYGIDPWSSQASVVGMDGVNKEWWGAIDHDAIYAGLVQKVYEFGLTPYVKLIRSTSENAPLIYDIDLLHIDGNHSEETSLYDVKKWFPLVKQGGLIVFDDTTWGTTSRAVQWLDAHCKRIADYHEDADWSIWIKQ